MACVVSVINLKGGVGKTTTTVALAETLSAQHGKRVLVIDLDPQTNATIIMIGEKRWREINDRGHTLATVFADALSAGPPRFDLASTLQRRASDVKNAETIDLLPSSLDLIDLQDRLAIAPIVGSHAYRPTDVLRRAIQSTVDGYDVVLIDCPPNIGIITLNGLRMSDGYIIPTIPDFLSTYGIPQIVTRVGAFSRDTGHRIVPLGVLATKFQAASAVHRNVLRTMADDPEMPPLFGWTVKQTNQVSASAEFIPNYTRTFRQKYGYNLMAETYDAIAEELLERAERVRSRRVPA